MADEINPDVSNEKLTFISSLNEDTSSVQHYQHIEEIKSRTSSTEENNNHLHIQPIQNGDHHENSSTIQSVEPTENHSPETQFIEETTTINQQPTSPLHIEPVDISDQQEEPENSFEDSNILNNGDQSNVDTNFLTQMDRQDKPEEHRAQRELDEEEIPPAELPVDETPINHEIRNSSPESETHITDDRPLTELETPYEHHHETDDRPLTEVETPYENETHNLSSLPDLVTETFEQNHDDLISESIELENEIHFTEEDFPPLISVEPTLNEIDFPFLPSTSISVAQTFNQEENKVKSISLEFEDILGNKSLLKQTIVKGTLNTRPTRSTMIIISYTLSLVDNLTSNIRVIETVSNERYFVSECDIIPAIDICVQSMDRGERALIESDIRHCYGEIGCEEKQIPSISSLNSYKMQIDLELHDWISPPDIQILSIEERLYWGEKKRQMGNFNYRRQDYKTSLQCYRGALRFLDTDNNPLFISFDQNQRSILNDQFIRVQNNVAQVNLLLNKYEDCLIAVENVLKYDSKNVKALFRRGKALYELGKYDQTIQTLKLFIQIQKENSNRGIDFDKANEIISISENKLANYQKNEKEIYRRMFQPTTNSTLHQTKTNQQNENPRKNWWPYIGLSTAALALIGIFTFIKYRKVS